MPSLLLLAVIYLSKGVTGQLLPDDVTVQCEEGWYQYGNNCFKVGKTRIGWDAARDRCLDMGADLASVHSRDELEFLKTVVLLNSKSGFWIGLNDKKISGHHVWSDGSPVNFTNWDKNEPTLYFKDQKENCVQMIFNAQNEDKMGKWNDLVCDHSVHYLCQMPSNPALKSPNLKYCTDTTGGGYKFQTSCLHYVSTPRSWSEAEQYCQEKHDGHLISIQDNAYHFMVNFITKDMNISTQLWIGLKSTERQNVQKWSSGWLVLYEKWVAGFSQDKLREGDCVARMRNGLWDVRPCDSKYSFICEVNSVPAPKLEPSVEGLVCPKQPPIWKDLGGDYCYYYNDLEDITWLEANFDCARKGGLLASIHSDAEARSIEQLLRYKIRDVFFIGLFRKYDDTWAWMDGSKVTYLAFDKNEPNNKNEKCTDLRAEVSRWNDIACDAKRGYLCSVKKIPLNETRSEREILCSGELLTIE